MTEEEIKELGEKATRLELELAETRQESASRRIALKEFEGVDPKEYNELKTKLAELNTKAAEDSGKVEDIVDAIRTQKDQEIENLKSKLDKVSNEFKSEVIDKKLINEAAKMNAINPDQVSILLKNNIRLSESGDVEVLDGTGKVMHDADGNNVGISTYVESFLKENLHLARGVESGSGSSGGSTDSKPAEMSDEEKLKKALDKWG